jgi:diacylglycerol kinase (ATP)
MKLAPWGHRFRCAARGIAETIAREPSARVHLGAIIGVIVLGLALGVTSHEWALLALACGLVLSAECLNTAIERLADRVSTEREPALRVIKDAAAGGVLVATLAAIAVGLAVLGPKLLHRLFG